MWRQRKENVDKNFCWTLTEHGPGMESVYIFMYILYGNMYRFEVKREVVLV